MRTLMTSGKVAIAIATAAFPVSAVAANTRAATAIPTAPVASSQAAEKNRANAKWPLFVLGTAALVAVLVVLASAGGGDSDTPASRG